MSSDTPSVVAHFGLLATAAIVCVAMAAAILIWYLVRRPRLGRGVRVVLLFGFGILPIGAALSANVATYEHTKKRGFCGSCHVMEPYTNDSNDTDSDTLAARHARNPYFGGENCYTCHADYGMYGTVLTKVAGMGHVWQYYGAGWNDYTIDEALERIHINKPYPNENCMQCHTTRATIWNENENHAAVIDDVRANKISCASEGCHGPAHPFSKEAKLHKGATP